MQFHIDQLLMSFSLRMSLSQKKANILILETKNPIVVLKKSMLLQIKSQIFKNNRVRLKSVFILSKKQENLRMILASFISNR